MLTIAFIMSCTYTVSEANSQSWYTYAYVYNACRDCSTTSSKDDGSLGVLTAANASFVGANTEPTKLGSLTVLSRPDDCTTACSYQHQQDARASSMLASILQRASVALNEPQLPKLSLSSASILSVSSSIIHWPSCIFEQKTIKYELLCCCRRGSQSYRDAYEAYVQ